MALWMVRAGPHGEQEQSALENNIVTIGWNQIPDLNKINTKDELKQLYSNINPAANKMHLSRIVGQLWDFAKEIKKGDLVALPLKKQSLIAIGEISSDYEYKPINPEIQHIRFVKWIKLIPRSQFDQDLLFSLGAFSTVCEIKRNNAESRIKSMIDERVYTNYNRDKSNLKDIDSIEYLDIEQYAKDQIIKYITSKFSGHNLARLVESIIQVQGYITKKSEPGKDGGVDILAGHEPLGFSEPRICVQVKSSASPIDVRVLRELQGVMQKVHATQGLLVSWGGFTKDTIQESKNLFFLIRLWDQGDLIEEIMKNYDLFDDELKAEIPLKRIWTIVNEEKK